MDTLQSLELFFSDKKRLESAFWPFRQPRPFDFRETIARLNAMPMQFPNLQYPRDFASWLGSIQETEGNGTYMGVKCIDDEYNAYRVLPLFYKISKFFFIDDNFFAEQAKLNPQINERTERLFRTAMEANADISFVVNFCPDFALGGDVLARTFREYAKKKRGLVFSCASQSVIPFSANTSEGFGSKGGSYDVRGSFESQPHHTNAVLRHTHCFYNSAVYMRLIGNSLGRIIHEAQLVEGH